MHMGVISVSFLFISSRGGVRYCNISIICQCCWKVKKVCGGRFFVWSASSSSRFYHSTQLHIILHNTITLLWRGGTIHTIQCPPHFWRGDGPPPPLFWHHYTCSPLEEIFNSIYPAPPQLPIPKILFHPLAILFHPLANLCKVCVTGTDRSPPPPLDLECGWRHTGNVQGGVLVNVQGGCFSIFRRADDVTRTMSKGCVCLWMSKSGGVFQIDDVTRTMSKGGGCAWCSTHPSSDPPPPDLDGWLRAWV